MEHFGLVGGIGFLVGAVAAPAQVRLSPEASGVQRSTAAPTVFFEDAKLGSSDAALNDRFGSSVAISGDTAAVGAYLDDHAAGADAGAVYVLVDDGTAWTEQQKLVASDAASGDFFAGTVAISGDTVVVGAAFDTDAGFRTGSAYVFVRSGTSWSEQQKLTASDLAPLCDFGFSVAISGDTAVMGADLDSEAANSGGSAYVFVRSGTVWTEEQELTASDAAAFDHLGSSVAVSGDTLVAGSPYDDNAAGVDAGAAYVFVRSGTVWTQQQKLVASSGNPNDIFGYTLAIEGDTIVVGAHRDSDADTDAGAAYVFVRSGTVWTQQQKLVASPATAEEQFGFSVSLSGERALIGTRSSDGLGSAYVFVRDGAVWSEWQALVGSDTIVDDLFGYAVALDGDRAIVGAPVEGIAGSVYAFGGEPTLVAFCDASDGAQASCPCGNPGVPDAGCDNAQGTGGVQLEALDYEPGAGTALLGGSGFPIATTPTAIVIRSGAKEPSPVAFGDGLRCVGLPIVRFGATLASSGQSVHTVNHGAGPGTFHYQLWYRSTPASFCTAAAFNTSNGLSIAWP